jgi:hypothetical protein
MAKRTRSDKKTANTIMGSKPQNASDEISVLYKTDKEPIIDIAYRSYSNLAFINIQPRDVVIDFLEAPPVIENGVARVKANRIFLTHTAAMSLAKVLTDVLNKAIESGKLEKV